jgi:hypothetical protein
VIRPDRRIAVGDSAHVLRLQKSTLYWATRHESAALFHHRVEMTSHSIAIARQRQTGPRDFAARMGAVCLGAWDVGEFFGFGVYTVRMHRRRAR